MNSIAQILVGLFCLASYQFIGLDAGANNWLFSIAGAFGLLLIGKAIVHKSSWDLVTFVCFFAVAFLVHYRAEVFFFWDEWHLIERFRTKGIWEIFTSHNEHFIPLSFLELYFQYRLFSTNYLLYLLVSFFFHTINCYLLYKIFARLFSFSEYAKKLAKAFALAYLISALHGEALQWAFEQTLLFSSTLLFFSLERALEFLETGEKKTLFISAASAVLAPLYFGNGFIIILFLGALSINHFFLTGDPKKAIASCSVVSAALFLPFFLYLIFADFSSSANPENPFGLGYKVKYSIKYLIFGSQLGTITRGLGLYPGLSFGSARKALTPGEEGLQFSSITDFSDAENIFVFLGLALSIVFFIYAFNAKKQRKEKLLLYFMGQLWIVLAFLLPAWSRYQLGHGQSLSLRYQYMALPGLFILMAPAAMAIVSNWSKSLINLICALFLFSQLVLASRFDYFTSKGEKNRAFISQLDKAETVPLSLTPGFSVEQVRANWQWLKD